jgi:hypothetical protein
MPKFVFKVKNTYVYLEVNLILTDSAANSKASSWDLPRITFAAEYALEKIQIEFDR